MEYLRLPPRATASVTASQTRTPTLRISESKKHLLTELLELGFPLNAATCIILNSDVTNGNEALNFVSTDEFGLYNHPFIADDENTTKCVICDSHESFKHMDNDKMANQTASRLSPSKAKSPRNNRPGDMLFSHEDNSHGFNWSSAEESKNGGNNEEAHMSKSPCLCLVCYKGEKPDVNFLGAGHQICKQCFTDFLKEQILNGKVEKLSCPHCEIEIPEETLQCMLDEKLFEKYRTFKQNIEFMKDPRSRYCPNPRCSKVVKLVTLEDRMAKCHGCDTEICGKCGRLFHGDKSCEKMLDEELRQWKHGKDVSQCPKCNMCVEKNEGCNHMTCPVCTMEWCWLCGAMYTKFHYSEFNPFGCPGLQFVRTRGNSWTRTRLCIFRWLMLTAFMIALPFLVVLGFPVTLSLFLTENCCCHSFVMRIPFYAIFFCIGMVLNIVVIPLAIILAIPVGMYLVVSHIKKRWDIHRNYRRRIYNDTL